MNTKKTGKFIAERRKALSLNQKQLAEKVGVTDKAVSKWETGRSAPDISLLIPLSSVLDVGVTEILNGEKIEEEKLGEKTDEMLVKTIKKTKRKVIMAVVISLAALSFILSLYPLHCYFTSVDINDTKAIEKMANDYFSDDTGYMKILKSVTNGEYYAFLMKNEKNVKLRIFKESDIFENRIYVIGGAEGLDDYDISLHAFGEKRKSISVFYGVDVKLKEYSYSYRGVWCTKTVNEDGIVLDLIVDMNDAWTHPLLEYN